MEYLIMWGIVLLLALLSFLIGIGKGDWLISGYNTASAKDRAKYNIRILRKIMSIGLGISALFIAATNLPISTDLPGFNQFSGIFILVVCIVMVILANTIAKRKEPVIIVETEEDKQKHRKVTRISLILSVIILAFVTISLFTGNFDYRISNSILHITASNWKDIDISLEEIESVLLEENITLGRRTFGVGNFKIRGGNFKNQDFGKYTLYSFNSCKTYIVIKTDNQTYVLNKPTVLETEELCQSLLEYVETK